MTGVQTWLSDLGGFKRIVAKLKAAKGNKKRKCRKNKPYQRAKYPGQKVQVDVKFVPAECVVDGRKYYQFTAVDECTRWTYRVYPRFCVNSNEAVQNINQLRTSGQRSYPMSACVHHSMPDGRSQGRREAPFIAAPAGCEDP